MSIKAHPPQNLLHIPVLLEQVLKTLQPKSGESYLDLTAGYGGHANAVLAITKNYAESVLVDRDENAIKHLKSLETKGARLMHTDFAEAAWQLANEGRKFDMLLVDLGVSSPQLDNAERGFSFTNSGPLDMRMDQSQDMTAEKLINAASENQLTQIIVDYGEEPFNRSRRIAKAIIDNRPINTTKDLAEIIKQNYRGKWAKTHPATRTFQALRIAVNQELKQVEELLPLIPNLLNKGGRVGIISFHSLEDRIVKRFLKEQFDEGYEAVLQPVTQKPIQGATHDAFNPRSRSAKLRVAVKK